MSQTDKLAKDPELTDDAAEAIPKIDSYGTADEVVLLCDMPGVKAADLHVRIEHGQLHLFGKIAARSMPGDCINREYDISRFSRAFPIASVVDTDKISAECCDGVVTVHLPKRESAKPKQVVVHHAG
jgi:HSP20 family protein